MYLGIRTPQIGCFTRIHTLLTLILSSFLPILLTLYRCPNYRAKWDGKKDFSLLEREDLFRNA